jgi:glycosyltransferase involved in cell wall biosynthesis
MESVRIRTVPERTRVLWLIKGLGPGGAEHLLLGAAAVADHARFEYEVAYLLPWKDALAERIAANGVPTHCFGVRDERDLRWVASLRRKLRRRPVHIVHSHSPYVAAMARLAVRSLPKRVRPLLVCTEHNAWSTFRPATRRVNALTSRWDDATIAVSRETLESMSGKARERAELLVHGVDTSAVAAQRDERLAARTELGIAPDTVLVGTVANYHPKKDWPNLLHAARRVADLGSSAKIRFCFVGQGPLEAEVTALHRHLELDGIVTLTGHRPDAIRLMAGCDIFVLGSKYEGLPVAIMEALALGLPIVATSVGGIPEALTAGEDALLVPPADPNALAAGIVALATDPDRRKQFGAAAARRSHDFDIVRAQSRIEAIYSELVERSS